MGFPRLMNDDEPMEFIMTNDRILQVFQWEHRIRYLWTDGRSLPAGENLENLGPAWYGHSVARWEGNKVIIDQDAAGPGGTDMQAILSFINSLEAEVLGITVLTGDAWRDEEVQHTL